MEAEKSACDQRNRVDEIERRYSLILGHVTTLPLRTLFDDEREHSNDRFVEIYSLTEDFLEDHLELFEIKIDTKKRIREGLDKDLTSHNYHEALIKAFFEPDSPFFILFDDERDGKDATDKTRSILDAWRTWRNAWVKRTSNETGAQNEGMWAFQEMPHLVQKLREVIDLALLLRKNGGQVIQYKVPEGQTRIDEIEETLKRLHHGRPKRPGTPKMRDWCPALGQRGSWW